MNKVLIPILCIAISVSVEAQTVPTSALEVQADRVEWDEKTGELRFLGSIELRWGQVALHCLELVARRGADGALNQVTARGEVTVTGPQWSAQAGHAQYQKAADTLILTESPQIRRQGSFLEGKRIILHLNSKRVVVNGAKGRLSSPGELRTLLSDGKRP